MREAGKEMEYAVSGKLLCSSEPDFAKLRLRVNAFVAGKEVASTAVDKTGNYELVFKYADIPPITELRIVPDDLSPRCRQAMTYGKTLHPSRYKLQHRSPAMYVASCDLLISANYLNRIRWFTKTYHMSGTVFAQYPYHLEELPNVRIDFCQAGSEPSSDQYLGSTVTGPDGNYKFEFKIKSLGFYNYFTGVVQPRPHIRARLSQSIDGDWKQVFESPVDQDIPDVFERDYVIPIENTQPSPPDPDKPDTGFLFSTLGLLPISSDRIVAGYGSSKPNDQVTLYKQPFCGTLRIFGAFGKSEHVVSYKVQRATADENQATGNWEDITDALYNSKWDGATFVPCVLGPDQATGRYKNVDDDPPGTWAEQYLKVTWNSSAVPNGYYALRIVGYRANNTQVVQEMPIIRVDNTMPDVKLEVDPAYSVGPCGHLSLPSNREIKFIVTAHDAEGHVQSYSLGGVRGRDAKSAGPGVGLSRQAVGQDHWEGISEEPVAFKVDSLPQDLADCGTLPYSFVLTVLGTPTNGYQVQYPQWVTKQVLLVVAEP